LETEMSGPRRPIILLSGSRSCSRSLAIEAHPGSIRCSQPKVEGGFSSFVQNLDRSLRKRRFRAYCRRCSADSALRTGASFTIRHTKPPTLTSRKATNTRYSESGSVPSRTRLQNATIRPAITPRPVTSSVRPRSGLVATPICLIESAVFTLFETKQLVRSR